MCMFCRSLFVLLYFFWRMCFLFFFDIWILITSLWYLQTFPLIEPTKYMYSGIFQGILGNGIFCLFGNFSSTKILGKLLYLLIALILMLLSIYFILFITTLRTSIQCHIFISVYLDYWSLAYQ